MPGFDKARAGWPVIEGRRNAEGWKGHISCTPEEIVQHDGIVPQGVFTDAIRKILTTVDFSHACKAGVRCALELARANGAEVVVYYVIPPAEAWLARHDEFSSLEECIEKNKKRTIEFLEEHFADCLSQVSVRVVAEIGVAHKMIVTRAQEEKVDIIVMSTRGASGVSHLAIGSVTEKVVGRAFCPVLTVRGKGEAQREQSELT